MGLQWRRHMPGDADALGRRNIVATNQMADAEIALWETSREM